MHRLELKVIGALLCFLVASAALAQSAGLPAGASQPAPPRYVDLTDDHWAADAIERLTALGIITGYPDSTFGGSRAATRYELAVVAARLIDLMSGSLAGLLGDPDFRRAIEDAGSNNARLLRLERLIEQAAAADYAEDLAARLAAVEEYLNEQAGEQLFPGLSALDDSAPASVTAQDPLSDETIASIASQLEQQLEAERASRATAGNLYFGVNMGYPVAGGLHFGVREVLPNTQVRLSVGYALPESFAIGVDVLYGFEGVFGSAPVELYTGGGLGTRVSRAGSSLDLLLLVGAEYRPAGTGPATFIIEAGPLVTLLPDTGAAGLHVRAGMNYRF